MHTRTMTIVFAAALAAACLGGCSSGKSDDALATTIKAEMFSDPQVKSADVIVAVKDGEATLSGDVPDGAARDRAFRLASDTPGVKHVVDQMTLQSAAIAPPPPIPSSAPELAPPDPEPAPARKTAKNHRRETAAARQDDYLPPQDTFAPPTQSAQPIEQAPPPQAIAPPQPTPEAAPPPPPPPPPQAKHVEIPSGTPLRVQTIDAIDSAVNKAGETFHASLAMPIVVNNEVVVPVGTDIWVKLVNAQASGQFGGQSHLALQVIRMEYQGQSYALTSNEYSQSGANRSKRTAETVGGGAVLGAVLGGLIGHGKGAAIGAASGAGAGTVAEAASKAKQIQIPSETKLDFSLQQAVDVSYFPDKNAAPRN